MTAQVSRRQFLKLSAAALGGAASWPTRRSPSAASLRRRSGCRALDADRHQPVRRLRQLPALVHRGERPATRPSRTCDKLQAENFTFLQKVDLEGGKTRYVKRQCMHCLDAACASACPVSALHQTHRRADRLPADRCLGCRYCMVSCPFNVPTFEWDNGLTPEIRKCMFCIERQRDGQGPACAANCPSGALKFGTRDELLKEAHARIAAGNGPLRRSRLRRA